MSTRKQASRRSRGQSLVEFALILPVMLTIVGAIVDVARVYPVWIALESATREATEYVASKEITTAAAQSRAQAMVCSAMATVPGFQAPAGNAAACTVPQVTVPSFVLSTTAPGASSKYPIATVTVRATFPFRTIFPYPLFSQNGAWTVSSERTYSVIQGRGG